MKTFDVNKRQIMKFGEFKKADETVNKVDKAKHEIVKDGYSGGEEGKAGVAVLDKAKIEKGEHDAVKDSMPGDKKGNKGIETLDESIELNEGLELKTETFLKNNAINKDNSRFKNGYFIITGTDEQYLVLKVEALGDKEFVNNKIGKNLI